MRVLLVSPSYARVGCGVGDHVACLAAELAGRGVEVHLATDPPGTPRRRLPVGIEVHSVLARHTRGEIRVLARLARDLEPDVVHIQYQVLTFSDHAAIFALPGMLGRRTAVAVTMHDFLLPYMFRGAGLLRRALVRRFLRRSDAVVVATAGHRALALAAGARAGSVHDLIMASNIGVHPLTSEREGELRERFAIGERTLLLSFGAISLAGGGDLLLAALSRVPAAARAHLRCLLVGGAPAYSGDPARDLRAVRELVEALELEDCVRVTGYLDAPEVSGLLQMSRAVVQARTEGISPMSTSVSSAILHRQRLLAVGGAEGLDERMPAAAIHWSAAEPEALAEAIRGVLDGRDLWGPTAGEALRAGADRFAWRHSADQHCEIYDEIIRRRRRGVSGDR